MSSSSCRRPRAPAARSVNPAVNSSGLVRWCTKSWDKISSTKTFSVIRACSIISMHSNNTGGSTDRKFEVRHPKSACWVSGMGLSPWEVVMSPITSRDTEQSKLMARSWLSTVVGMFARTLLIASSQALPVLIVLASNNRCTASSALPGFRPSSAPSGPGAGALAPGAWGRRRCARRCSIHCSSVIMSPCLGWRSARRRARRCSTHSCPAASSSSILICGSSGGAGSGGLFSSAFRASQVVSSASGSASCARRCARRWARECRAAAVTIVPKPFTPSVGGRDTLLVCSDEDLLPARSPGRRRGRPSLGAPGGGAGGPTAAASDRCKPSSFSSKAIRSCRDSCVTSMFPMAATTARLESTGLEVVRSGLSPSSSPRRSP
mmetsp:Transcript_36416/g.95668  ORF Transcript_36416/g.95668 Transcript_36416/m.95668 type:complete len:378 (-) Transcript_36416:685-1818(-)